MVSSFGASVVDSGAGASAAGCSVAGTSAAGCSVAGASVTGVVSWVLLTSVVSFSGTVVGVCCATCEISNFI